MHDLEKYIADLPKAELHIHIEGSLEPELMFSLARRNGMSLPFKTVEEVRAAYEFSCLQDFLEIYYQGADVLRKEEDFRDLALAYFARAADDNVVHAEVFFDPQTHTSRGVPFSTVVKGLLAGMEEARSRFAISSKLILCFLRHLDEASAFDTLREAESWLDRIEAVGLDSSELGHPPSKFERVFKAAAERGLKRVAHAGEEGPPAYIYEALDILGIDWLDHGNRALEDSQLVRRLAAAGTTLTVCPLSNVKLGIVKRIGEHPIDDMLAKGLRVTINSDDPAYFGGYVNDNYRAVARARNLTADQLFAVAHNSFTGSFLSPREIEGHLERLAAYHELASNSQAMS